MLNLALQARNRVRKFFAHRCRCRGLAVGACEHRHVRITLRVFAYRRSHLLHQRQQHITPTVSQHQRVGQVVDVF